MTTAAHKSVLAAVLEHVERGIAYALKGSIILLELLERYFYFLVYFCLMIPIGWATALFILNVGAAQWQSAFGAFMRGGNFLFYFGSISFGAWVFKELGVLAAHLIGRLIEKVHGLFAPRPAQDDGAQG